MAGFVTTHGVQELVRALAQAGAELPKQVRKELRATGNLVRDDARGRFSRYDSRSAAGMRTYVRRRGVAVEQSIGRTTGRRPDFGALQMREALVPALEANTEEAFRRFDETVDNVTRAAGLT